MEVPMLGEREYAIVVTDQFKRAIQEVGPSGSQEKVQQRTQELTVVEYERLTGVRIADPWHIVRHTTIGPGPPCSTCGKPLRTPKARMCGRAWLRSQEPES